MALVVACLGGTPVLADTSIDGWNVSAKPDANGVCSATRSYVDADDDNQPIEFVDLNLTDKIGGLVPGEFVIKLKVDDLVSGKSADATIPFTMVK